MTNNMTNNAMLEGLKSLTWQRGQNRKITGHTHIRKTRESAGTPFYRPLNFRNVGAEGSNPFISTIAQHQGPSGPFFICRGRTGCS